MLQLCLYDLISTPIATAESMLELILKNERERVSDSLCVSLPVSKNCCKGALEYYPLTQTFLLCQTLHLSCHSQSQGNPHLAEASALFSS